MTPERWQQIEQLYEAYLAYPSDERAAFLDQACADDPGLRVAFKSLLAAQDEAPPLLEVSYAGLPSAPAEEPVPDTRIGPYRLLRTLGQGGMGVVYLAERADGQFAQRVALKLLRHGRDTDDLLSRFRYERQLLAGLEHPHIARLLDGGTTPPGPGETQGRPYFVMEYVEGEPITAYCDTHRLSTEQRIALFRTVCRAVQYAHQNLIIHRDLKPSNILVTQEGTVKLLDFGIAKLLNDEVLDQTIPRTDPGLRLMTPEYASPEQIRGEAITTQTDVYQLGVLLYELLTGHRPYRLGERLRHEIERVILEEEPTRPSTVIGQTAEILRGIATDRITPEAVSSARSTTPDTLQRHLAGDLDTIALTALKKDPARRYASVEALTEDLRRHLAGLPVAARPDTFGYRAAKFIQRHRAGVGMATVFVLILLGFSVAMAVQSARIRAQAAEVARERDKAEEVATFLVDLFEAANPNEARESLTVQDLLTRGAEKVEHELTAQPAVQADLMDVMGRAHRNLGWYDEAERLARRALELRQNDATASPADVVSSLYTLAYVRRSQGAIDEADSLFRAGLSLTEKHLGHLHTLTQAGLYGLGTLTGEEKGQYQAADSLLREALAIGRAVLDAHDPDLATILQALSSALRYQQRYDEAEPLLREALAIKRTVYGADHIRVAHSLHELASLFAVTSAFDDAEALYHEALTIYRNRLGPENVHAARVLYNLGRMQMGQENYAAAAPTLREALTLRRTLLGNDHLRVAAAALHLGRALIPLNQLDEAEALIREALAIRQSRLGATNWQIASARMELGICLTARQRYDEAEPLLQEGLAGLEAELGPDHRGTQQAREALTHLQNVMTQ